PLPIWTRAQGRESCGIVGRIGEADLYGPPVSWAPQGLPFLFGRGVPDAAPANLPVRACTEQHGLTVGPDRERDWGPRDRAASGEQGLLASSLACQAHDLRPGAGR